MFNGLVAFLNNFPGRFIIFVLVFSSYVKIELIGVGFTEEVVERAEGFYFIEFIPHGGIMR